MKKSLTQLLDANRKWSSEVNQEDPEFFGRLAAQQKPKYLWIGCADSRVPANTICGLEPGEVFVHRNVANMVVHTDLNCLSVVQYAVEVLQVTDVIVCGHYGCGGVAGALGNQPLGLIDNWLYNIKDVYLRHQEELETIDPAQRVNRLCELNVKSQVHNLCYTTIVQDAWARGQNLTVHGWIYGLGDGLLKDLSVSKNASDQLPPIYRMTERLPAG